MPTDRFVYVTYIRAPQQKVWDYLTTPEFLKQYWFGATQTSTWQKGASWEINFADGRVADSGEILDVDAPNKLVIKWRNEFMPEVKAEGYGRCTYDLVTENETTKLTVTHEIDKADSKLIKGVSGGWPKILSALKTLLETGQPLVQPSKAA